jgi:hypothetical protein
LKSTNLQQVFSPCVSFAYLFGMETFFHFLKFYVYIMISFYALYILFHEQCKLEDNRFIVKPRFLVLISILYGFNTQPLD